MSLASENDKVSTAVTMEKHQSFLEKIFSKWSLWRSTFFALASLGVLICIIIIAVVLPVCILHGCGARKQDMTKEEQLPPLRLIVHFDNVQATVKSKLPPSLHDLFDEVVLTAIRVNIVSFRTYDVFYQVERFLQSQPDVLILLRDRQQGQLPPRLSPSLLDTYGALRRQLQEGANVSSLQLTQDPMTSEQWALDRTLVRDAWSTSQGAGIVVAVVDSGCDIEHPDLKNNLWINPGETPNDGIDNDMNDRIDDVHGFDFAGPCPLNSTPPECGPRASVTDYEGHGSHCSGIVGAIQNNGVGIIGVAPQVKLMCLKVIPNDRTYYFAHILSALNYAIIQGAHIISCSFGPSGVYNSSQVRGETAMYGLALQEIKRRNMLLVAAAGNEGRDLDNVEYYNPCTLVRDYPENMLCVMATDKLGQPLFMGMGGVTSSTNYGRRTVSVAAPGLNILSTYVPKTWVNLSGSSMATPMVAGVAALIMSVLSFRDGNYYKGTEARSIVMGTGFIIPGFDHKLINARGAVDGALSHLNGVILLNNELDLDSQNWSIVEGFNLTYYSSRSLDARSIIDEGTQVIVNTSRIEGYKFNNATLEVRAYMKLSQPGLYEFRVNTTANPSSLTLAIGGREIRSMTQTQILQSTGGWYVFQLIYENPVAPINILMTTSDSADEPQFASGVFFTATNNPPRSFYYAPDIALSSTWQVLTRDIARLNTSVIHSSMLSLDMQGYNTSAVVEVLNFTSVPGSALRASLGLNASARPTPLVGIAHTRFRVPNVTSGSIRFQVSCELCALYVNGLRILDLYDPRLFLSPVTQMSNCVSLPGNLLHDLELRFAIGNDTATTSLVVGWRACNTQGGAVQPLGPYLMNNLFWQPSSGVAGYVSGVQCDVWLDTGGTRVEREVLPTIKFRLPTVLAQSPVLPAKSISRTYSDVYRTVRASGCSANETAAGSNCSAAIAFSLSDVIYNVSRADRLFGTPLPDSVYMRCWTYVNAGFRNGAVQNYFGMESSVFLGSQRVLNSRKTFGTLYATYAPNTTALGNYYQLLVMEFPGLPLDRIVGITNGTAGELVVMDMERTLLPIPLVTATGASNPGSTTGASNRVGRRRFLAATDDVSSDITGTFNPHKVTLTGDQVNIAHVTDSSVLGNKGHRKLQQLDLSNSRVYVPTFLGASSYTGPTTTTAYGLLGKSYNITNTNRGLLSTVFNDVSLITGNNSRVCVALNPIPVCSFPDSANRRSTLLQLKGFLRLPGDASGTPSGSKDMSRWVLRMVENSAQQTTAINIADVTIRNGVEVNASTAPANETVIWLPSSRSNTNFFLPVVISTRVENKQAMMGDFSGISLVTPGQSALVSGVNSSLWYCNSG